MLQTTYQAGDRVLVFETGILAAQAQSGKLVNDGNPRTGTVLREHPNEPGTFEVEFDDSPGNSGYVADVYRLRPAPVAKE